MSNNKSSSFYYNQISKKGLLENDRKLLLKLHEQNKDKNITDDSMLLELAKYKVKIIEGEYVYIGEWKNGKMNGKGTYIWKNGEKLVGEVRNSNAFNCEGVFHFKGCKFYGAFLKELFHSECRCH